MMSGVIDSTMRAISSLPQSTARSPGIRSTRSATRALSARRSPQTKTSSFRSCPRSVSSAALTVWKAETTVTPSGTISWACWAADPCQTPKVRVALPLTAAASGTVASTSSCSFLSTVLRFVSVSDWLRNGTDKITTGPCVTAAAFSRPVHGPVGTSLPARAAASSARRAPREPITIGTPSWPSRSAKPKPNAPVAPTMHTGSGTARECILPSALGRRGFHLEIGGRVKAVALVAALAVVVGTGASTSAWAGSPPTVQWASLAQSGQNLVWRAQLNGPFTAAGLASQNATFCLLIERISDVAVNQQICLAPANRHSALVVSYNGQRRTIGATITRPSSTTFQATFPSGAIGL